MSEQVESMLISSAVAVIVALLTSLATVIVSERKLRRDYRLEFSAEAAVKALLMDRRWHLRSFDVIKQHVGGFSDEALRQLLVRAGAIRFRSNNGGELWGLLERNRDRLDAKPIDDRT